MEDRYEIIGKIAQGGLGSVYKARDLRMSRDVAIKRILTNPDDSSVTNEATRQLIKEASALASLQHPNIVTVYDVGMDADGPFVVMELLTGQTLEEIVSEGSMTWEDFRILVLQSLEALIAAQELHIVHRDIKPGNIMINWLPSKKFQVKVVDFGLAKLSSKPSLQTIDQSDGVFGSIYFMGPEQFERIPIDQRVDIYAIGCVFYYALTGSYPFDGDTAVEVMASHLQHHVTPIQEVREGIPLWACNWIMWLINRQPGDRPGSAREALEIFVDNDAAHYAPELSTGAPTPAATEPKRPKLFIPGAAPEVVEQPVQTITKKTAIAPKALRPPGTKSVPPVQEVPPAPAPQPPAPEPVVMQPEPTPVQVEAPPVYQEPIPAAPQLVVPTASTPAYTPAPPTPQLITPAAPQLVVPTASAPAYTPAPPAPPALAIPQVATPAIARTTPTAPAAQAVLRPTSNFAQPGLAATTKSANVVSPTAPVETTFTQSSPKKKPSPAVMVGVSVGMGIVVIFLIFFLLGKKRENAEIALFNEVITAATKDGATEVPVNKEKLEILLENATTSTDLKDRYNIYLALYLAKSSDGTDIDSIIATRATTQSMHPDVRVILIRDVLGKRRNPSVIQTLLDFSKSTNEPASAVAAMEACRFMANETHLQKFLDVLVGTSNEQIRKAAEENIITILKNHKSNDSFRSSLITTHNNSPNDSIKHATLRIIGLVGGDQAIEIIKKNLNNPDTKTKIAALGALGNSKDESGFTMLLDYISGETNLAHRALAFDAAIKYCNEAKENKQTAWTKLAELAKIQEDEMRLINGIANTDPEPWAFAILDKIIKTSKNDASVDRAERAVDYLEKMKAIKGGAGKKE